MTNGPLRPRRRRLRLLGTLVALALAGTAALIGPASAAPGDVGAQAPDAASGDGWVRLAHYSPDTPSVDVSLAAIGNNATMLSLADVSYGTITAYERVPAGTYFASMLPAGGSTGTPPIVTQALTVEAGRAYTVAAIGDNARLTGTVYTDDLTPPAAGQSRVRVIQASVSSPQVTVQAAGGPLVASNATFGAATSYSTIAPGVWTVQLTGVTGEPVTTQVTVTPGTVNTLTVLDRGTGLALESTVDASTVGAVTPGGGVETGGGSTAVTVLDRAGSPVAPVVTGLSAIVLAGVVGSSVRRRYAPATR